jgi:hypothetical protein
MKKKGEITETDDSQMWLTPVILALRRQKQEDQEFKASLRDTVRPPSQQKQRDDKVGSESP